MKLRALGRSQWLRLVFLTCSREERERWVDHMYRTLTLEAPEQTDDAIKTIRTLTLLKGTLGASYLDDPGLWGALGYRPIQPRAWNPPTGPDIEHPPRSETAELLHRERRTPESCAKRTRRRKYCVVGSGAGGGVVAHSIKALDRDAEVVLLEAGPLATNDMFGLSFLDAVGSLYANAATTLSKDEQFTFRQARCVGGGTTLNNSVAIKPTGFWWDQNIVEHWRQLGVELDWPRLHAQYDVLEKKLNVHPLEDRVITKAAKLGAEGLTRIGPATAQPCPSNTELCIGCGRCNIGCQYDAKRSLMATLIPEFVRKGGALVPDASAKRLHFESIGQRQRVTSVEVSSKSGDTVRIEADKFVLAAGPYASTKLLWRSGFLGAVPGVRTVGKRFSVNAGAPVFGLFPNSTGPFDGQQIGYVFEIIADRMVVETAASPPAVIGLMLPFWGEEFQRKIRQMTRMAGAVPVFGTYAYGDIRRGLLGESGFVIDFQLVDEDWRRLERGMITCARAFFDMGAEEIWINRFDGRTLRSGGDVRRYFAGLGPADFVGVESAHLQGGNVIAPRPDLGVIDTEFKVFGFDNLWITDASVIPAPITVNIALTTMALASYAAKGIVEA